MWAAWDRHASHILAQGRLATHGLEQLGPNIPGPTAPNVQIER